MAFKERNTFGRTVYLGDDTKAGQVKSWTGYPVDVKVVDGKKKGESFTFILAVEKDDKHAEQVSVLACGQVKGALCIKDEHGEAQAIKPDCKGKLTRLTYLGREKVKGFAQPLIQVKVEVDDEATLKHYEIPNI